MMLHYSNSYPNEDNELQIEERDSDSSFLFWNKLWKGSFYTVTEKKKNISLGLHSAQK